MYFEAYYVESVGPHRLAIWLYATQSKVLRLVGGGVTADCLS